MKKHNVLMFYTQRITTRILKTSDYFYDKNYSNHDDMSIVVDIFMSTRH